MSDYVVDLDICVSGPDSWDEQIVVAITAPSRVWAANKAITRAYEEYRPFNVASAAVEDFDGWFDRDWR